MGIAAAQLQSDWMLFCIETHMALYAAVADGTGGDHLGVKHRVLR
jgi:hypothetical protein